MRKFRKYICNWCKKEFYSRQKDPIYCSQKCFGKSSRGKKFSIEQRIKMSISHKGQHNSPNTEFKKGNIPWTKNRKGLKPYHNIEGFKLGQGWNKGIKGTHFSTKTEFKKGQKPWNIGLKGFLIGEKSPHWKGGKFKNKAGYVSIYSPKHPSIKNRRYISEHRLIMEKKLNRYLKPSEVVHHINKNPFDNRVENLKLFKNNTEHLAFHRNIKNKLKFLS